jgi:hypothetical protein
MRTRVRGRRHNPLRRGPDVAETWTAVLFAVLLFLGAPLLGAFTARWARDATRATRAAQRADRHRVHAEVVGRPPDRAAAFTRRRSSCVGGGRTPEGAGRAGHLPSSPGVCRWAVR